jgi:hypothetical protein
MATQTKFSSFPEALAEKIHNLGSDQLVIALSNVAPTAATNTQLSNITEIVYTNISSRNITTTSSSQTGGTYKLVLTELVLTASGTVPDFRYVILYNDTATNDELISFIDHGSTVSMTTGQTYTINFSDAAGVLTY